MVVTLSLLPQKPHSEALLSESLQPGPARFGPGPEARDAAPRAGLASERYRRSARHSGFQPKLPPNGPLKLMSPTGLHHPHIAQMAPRFRRNLKPTKPAVQISDADRTSKRKILITDKCTMTKAQKMAGKRRVLPGRSVQVH